MRQPIGTRKSPGAKIVKDIKRATRKQYSSEEKIRIVLDGLRRISVGFQGCLKKWKRLLNLTNVNSQYTHIVIGRGMLGVCL